MNFVRSMSQPDTLEDISIMLSNSVVKFNHVGYETVNVMKFLLYDVTVTLRGLPFGNWVSLVYFVCMSAAIKDIIIGGELNRLIFRYIDTCIVQQKTHKDCVSRFRSYFLRIIMNQINYVEYAAYNWVKCAWSYVGGTVKSKAKQFAAEIIANNADEIEKTVVEISKTAAFSAVVSIISQQLINEIGPIAVDVFSKSNMAITMTDIQQTTGTLQICSTETVLHNQRIERAIDQLILSNKEIHNHAQLLSKNLEDAVMIIMDAEKNNNIHHIEDNISLNNKLSEMSAQLEYLRINQPVQFKEIVNTVSLSTLALNDIVLPSGLPSSVMNVLSTFSGAFGSSASQQGRKRIDFIE